MPEVDRGCSRRLHEAETEFMELVRGKGRYQIDVPTLTPRQHVANSAADEHDPVMAGEGEEALQKGEGCGHVFSISSCFYPGPPV